jgi:hypothetical protein
MIARSEATRRPALQLHLDLGESPAPATALWGILPEDEREAAAAVVAQLIARTVVPEDEVDGPGEAGGDER